jgi:hypothetical protein
MKKVGVSVLAISLLTVSAAPMSAQVNMQYSGQYSGQYNGQYGGQFSGQYSGQYYGRDSAPPNNRYNDYFDYPTNTGACGQLYYPSPGTDNVYHDRQGRRCY